MRDIELGGLIAHPGPVDAERLRRLTQAEACRDFSCLEGWSIPDVQWEGVPFRDLDDLVGALPSARYVAVGAGTYVAVMARDAACQRGLLATRRNGAPLTSKTGGPVRFVLLDGPCYTSVKGVDRITWLDHPVEDTASQIAAERLRAARSAVRILSPAEPPTPSNLTSSPVPVPQAFDRVGVGRKRCAPIGQGRA